MGRGGEEGARLETDGSDMPLEFTSNRLCQIIGRVFVTQIPYITWNCTTAEFCVTRKAK